MRFVFSRPHLPLFLALHDTTSWDVDYLFDFVGFCNFRVGNARTAHLIGALMVTNIYAPDSVGSPVVREVRGNLAGESVQDGDSYALKTATTREIVSGNKDGLRSWKIFLDQEIAKQRATHNATKLCSYMVSLHRVRNDQG